MNKIANKASTKKTQGQENFDWHAYQYGKNQEEESKLIELQKNHNDSFSEFKELEIYKGIVTHIIDKNVIVDIGYKAEGIIHLNEFRGGAHPKEGQEIEILLEKLDRKGQCILSYLKAKVLWAWRQIEKAEESKEIIQGFITSRTKGGLIANVFGCIDCFVPGSQIEAKSLNSKNLDYAFYLGKTMDLVVIAMNKANNNVVMSHRALVEKDIESQKENILKKLNVGDVVEGMVKNITSWGVFIDLGGLDGLLHILDISWTRINHPSEVFQIGDKDKFVILSIDIDKKRVQLGKKQLMTPPWDTFIGSGAKEGDKIKGTVSAIMDYGAKVIIEPSGVEALLHISEMAWFTYQHVVEDFLKMGDEIEVSIQSIDTEEKKISLSLKRLTEDPWNTITKKYPVGSKHTCEVKKITSNVAILKLEKDIYGNLSIYDLDWLKKIKKVSDFLKEGDQIEVIVLETDEDKRLLKLGHKQLSENPWDLHAKNYKIDSIHKGKIKDLSEKGATLEVKDRDIEPFVPLRFLEKEDGSKLKEGEEAEFKVIEFDKDSRKIILSHSAVFQEAARKHINEQLKAQKPKKATLGDHKELIQLKKSLKGLKGSKPEDE